MLEKDLQQLGFTKNLAKVYVTLFDLGEAKAGEIVRRTGMHRNLVYTALQTLEEKKLVSKSKARGVALFAVLDPERIMGEVEQKQRLAEEIIEELKSKHQVTSQEIVIYEGKDEMIRKYKELYGGLDEGDYWDIIGLSPSFFEIHTKKDIEQLIALQNKKKFKVRGISGYIDPKEDQYVSDTSGLTEFKLMPSISKKDNEIAILKDRVLIFIFTAPYTIVEIFNDDLVAGYQEYFHILWGSNVQTWKGEEGARFLLRDTLNYSDVYWIGGNGGMETYYPDVWNWYKKKRIEQQVTWHDLIDPGMVLSGAKEGTTIYDEPYYEHKFLPETVASPHVICVYGDKVANIVWKEDSVINIIDDAAMAESYRKYHQYLWSQEVQTYVGWDQIHQLIFDKIFPNFAGQTEYAQGAGYDIADDPKAFEKFWLEYNTRRIELGITRHIMMYEPYREQFQQEIRDAGDPDNKLTHMRFLPKEFNSPMEVHIYGDTVVLIAWQGVPTATVYTRKEMSESFKNQFDMLWGIAKE